MSIIEFIPVDKGHRLTLDRTVVTTIGRTPNIGCLDKKISRNHAEIYVKSDGTLWIKPIHNNPTFFKGKDGQMITLTKDQEQQLNDSDQIGLLPTEYFYRISIQMNEPSAIPKTPEREPEKVRTPSPIHQRADSPKSDQGETATREPEGGIILHTKRSLPTWMANGESAQSKTPKGRGKGKTSTTTTPVKATPSPSPSKHRTYIGRKKVEGIVYGDDDDDDGEETDNSNDRTTSSRTNSSITYESKGTTKREKCPYGKFCYRKNPLHRQEAIHPGDPDWNDKENDDDNDRDKPECPYGSDCYRKNPDHHKQYSHPKRTNTTTTTKKSKKRRSSDEDDDDDDGLPNEYDYQDSFIDDADMEDSMRNDRAVNHHDDPDQDWKPHHKARASHDDDEDSTDDSEFELLREEAADFVQNSSAHHHARPAKKKAKLNLHDPEEE